MEEELEGVKYSLEPCSDSVTLSGLLKDSGDQTQKDTGILQPLCVSCGCTFWGRGCRALSTPVLCELGRYALLPAHYSLGTNELTLV